MKKLLFIPFLFGFTFLFAQNIPQQNTHLDSLLIREILDFRKDNRLPEMEENTVLASCSYHHTYYMWRSRIVSHYQDMRLRKIRRLYSPEDRIAFFSGNISLDDNTYSEICIGLRITETTPEEIAKRIFNEIMNSDNRIVLAHPETRYLGVSMLERKGVYYITINVGMGYNNAVALLN